jgi:Uma2 family endonuclease
MDQPLVLIEILSPTNVSKTRANVRVYQTIPGVAEIVVLRSSVVAADVLGRTPEGKWPQLVVFVVADDELLDSIGFSALLRDAYRTTNLTTASVGR